MIRHLCLTSLFSLTILGLGACAGSTDSAADRQVRENDALGSAQTIARNALIIDTHIDVPYRLQQNPADISQATAGGDFDYPRARQGGLKTAFMSIYIPAKVDEAGRATSFADETLDLVESLSQQHPDHFATATCTSDVRKLKNSGLVAFALGMENGGPIAGSFEQLTRYFERGIRYITLAHSKSNHISDSSYDTNEAWSGLSPFGKSLIPAMNKLGVIVDVSHLSDKAFWQVLELSQSPVLATHSSLRHFTPGWHRNMEDDMVRALAAQGGVIQINFGSAFLTQEARAWSDAQKSALENYRAAEQLAEDDPKLTTFSQSYLEAHPYPFAHLNDVLDHIDRAVELAGIDHVGVGSDYDGVGNTLPEQLKDAASYPNLVQGLLDRGYRKKDILKILGGNTLRVWSRNEAYARKQGTKTRCRL